MNGQLAIGWLTAAAFFALASLTFPPLIAVVVLQLVLAVRSWRLAVVPRERDVVIRNTMRTWRVPWTDVDRFEVGAWRLPGKPPCGALRRRDGSQITIVALNPGQLRDHPELDRMLEELNRIATEKRSGSSLARA